MDNQNWWEESAAQFADGFTETKMQSISLGGTHIAAIDEATGKLTIFDAQLLMEIPADEAYNLLVWLHDYHRERLHRLSHQDEKER